MPTTEQDPEHWQYLPSVFRKDVTSYEMKTVDGIDYITYKRDELARYIQLDRIETAIVELKALPCERHESDGSCNACFFIDNEDKWARIKELESQKNQLTGGKDE